MGLSAQAVDLNGEWRGHGVAEAGDCPEFAISVSVRNSKVTGTALQGDQDFGITGYVTSTGELRGEVSYLVWTIAELTGEIKRGQATGTWRTFKGPECQGRFVARKYQPQSASRAIAEIEESY